MCGRFTNTLTLPELLALYGALLDMDTVPPKPPRGKTWSPTVNIPPTTLIPVVYLKDGVRTLTLMRWGLVPSWSKALASFATHNARAESVADKSAFRDAWKAGRRCIIPASSFFEWRKSDKQPFAIALGNRGTLNFAGLWEAWQPLGGPPVLSCTVITCGPNDLMKPLHDRMPVIIGDEDIAAWLGEEPASPARIEALLQPFASDRMTAWPVSKDVGKVSATGPNLLDEVHPDPQLF